MVNDSDLDNANDRRMEERARAVLHESMGQLDAHTLSKLTQARHAALAQLQMSRMQRMRRFMLPAGSLATAALVAVVMWTGYIPSGIRAGAELAVDDVELVANEENLDLIQELEFYSWVGSEAPANNGDTG